MKKFRIWDKEYKDWIKDDCGGITCEGKIICYRSGGICPGWVEEYKQDQFVIQQCTGLKDKDGNLIYEGDLLEISEEDKLDTLNLTVMFGILSLVAVG